MPMQKSHISQCGSSPDPWKHSVCGLLLPIPWWCTLLGNVIFLHRHRFLLYCAKCIGVSWSQQNKKYWSIIPWLRRYIIRAGKGSMEMCDFHMAALMFPTGHRIKARIIAQCLYENCTFCNEVHHQGLGSTSLQAHGHEYLLYYSISKSILHYQLCKLWLHDSPASCLLTGKATC